MKSSILPDAQLEATEAAIWYELRRTGLGVEFTDELSRMRRRICDWPELWPRLECYPGPHEIRRCHFDPKFPYRIIFWRRSDEIVVIAVAHMRRRPFYWLERLG